MQMHKTFTCVISALLFIIIHISVSAQSSDSTTIQEARKAISASNAVYFQAFIKGDSSVFIDRYAEDCCIMSPNESAICGPDAALKFFRKAYYDYGLRDGRFITKEIFGIGKNYVAETGLWESYDINHLLMDEGKFLVLWKKTLKGWKMFRDSFSSNRKQL